MSLQVFAVDAGSAQVLLAGVAVVRAGGGVRTHMVVELQGPAEGFAAEGAGEADAGVHQLVALQGAQLLEALVTDGALEGPCVGVQPLVPPQGTGEGEAPPAQWARVGLLARVDAPVLGHVHVLDEALAAHGALEGPLPRVDTQVFLQRRGLQAVAAAHGATVSGLIAAPLHRLGRRHPHLPHLLGWNTDEIDQVMSPHRGKQTDGRAYMAINVMAYSTGVLNPEPFFSY